MALRIALVFSVLLFHLSFLQSQNVVWQQTNGPYAPRIIRKILHHPSGEIYCFSRSLYTDNYLLRSTDNGETWSEVNRRFVDPSTGVGIPLSIDYLTLHNDGSLYASASVQGVYRSTNRGVTWEKFFDRLGSISSYTLLGINSSGHLFALPFMSSNGYVYCSTNNGTSWERRENGLDTRFPTNVNFSVDAYDNLYLRDFNNKLYCSTDNGLQWSVLYSGNVDFVAAHSRGVLFLGTNNSTNYTTRLSRSTDQGKTWTDIFPDIASKKIRVMNILPGTNGQLFLYTKDTLLVSSDTGFSWQPTNLVLSGETITDVSVAADGKVFVGTDKGRLYRSGNSGTSWMKAGADFQRYASVNCFAANSGNKIFAGSLSDGLFVSTDNGLSWNASSTGLTGSTVTSLAVSAGDQLFVGISSNGLFTSSDAGTVWVKVTTPFPTKPVSWIGSNTRGYLFVHAPPDLYRSTDAGATWELKAASSSVYNMCVAIGANDDIYASFSNDLYCSTDNGETWNRRSSGLPASPAVTALAIGEQGGMFLGTTTGALYVSTDQGNSWISRPTGLRGPSNKIKNIICLPNNQLMLNVDAASGYVGINFEDYGIFHSANNGATWQFLNTSSQYSRETASTLYKTKDNKVLAGVGHGVMIWSPAATSVAALERYGAGRFELGQNYPNPFNPSTTISFSVPAKSFVSLKVLDVLGREASILLGEELSPGTYSRQWNAATAPSGVYFYRLQARPTDGGQAGDASTGSAWGYVETKRMILLK